MNRTRGFTLLEILIAMSLFTILGVAVVLLMRTGVDMWIDGTRSAQAEERVEQSLPRLEEDLRSTLVPSQRDRRPFDPEDPDPEEEPAPLVPENRFLSGYQLYRIGRSDKDVPCPYVAFVRDATGMGEIDVYLSRAGTNPKAQSYIDGIKDEEEFKRNDHLPTGGMVEVLWIYVPDEDDPGMGAVYRAYRTPIGGKDTLLDPKNFDDLEEKLMGKIGPQPVFQEVILFELLFWTQYTTTWEWERGDPRIRERPRDPGERTGGRPSCGPSRIWDSTRGLLTDDDWGFALKKEGSANFTADDIWPRMVRVQFALNEEEVPLAVTLGTTDTDFTVTVPDFATGRGDLYGQFMKVGTEWIRINGRDSRRRDRFLIGSRAERGTEVAAHPAGTPVRFGRIFDVTITVPSFRDDNN